MKKNKLSKSDGPAQADLWQMPVSAHFTVGTFVKISHLPPAEILEAFTTEDGRLLRIRHEDGRVEVIKPIALNR